MEPAQSKVRFLLGNFTVVDTKLAITIELGQGVNVHLHVGDFQHGLKPGDKISLYTEIPHAQRNNV